MHRYIITIDRSRRIRPPLIRGLEYVKVEQDCRSLLITTLDIRNIKLVSMLNDDERLISGTERLIRLKESRYIRLDEQVLFTILRRRKKLDLSFWKKAFNGNPWSIFFDGTIYQNHRGFHSRYLRWNGKRFDFYHMWHGFNFTKNRVSAVIEP
jgi:hypothetical protein